MEQLQEFWIALALGSDKWLGRKRRQFRAAAVQGGLDAAYRRANQIGDLLEGVVEDVLQQDASALLEG